MTTVRDIVGDCDLEEEFDTISLDEVNVVLDELNSCSIHDVAHAEYLQQKALACANYLANHLSRIVKIASFLESQISTQRNKTAAYYTRDDVKVTNDLRIFAAKACPEAAMLENKLSRVKGIKLLLEKKYDLLLKCHYYFKEIASSFKGIPQKTEW